MTLPLNNSGNRNATPMGQASISIRPSSNPKRPATRNSRMSPRKISRAIQFAACVLLMLLIAPCWGQQLRVMSFNIRNSDANDGANRWELRKTHVATTIKDQQPDLVGLQETLPKQARFLREHMGEFHYCGRSREKHDHGEQCSILIRKNRFDILEQGHFWLSKMPNVPGSKSWDSALPRMASWVKVFDSKTKKVIYFLNSHFDHRGKQAREQSAIVIMDKIRQFENGIPVVLVGDFNASPDSQAVRTLTQCLTDTFAVSNSKGEPNIGTFNGFRGNRTGSRIDFIFCDSGFKVLGAAIDRRKFDGRYPSDHFPVTALLSMETD